MIKNTIYSIFLHLLFLLLIYVNFNFEDFEESESNQVSISFIELKAPKKISEIKEEETTLINPEPIKEIVKEPEVIKKIEEKQEPVKEAQVIEEKPKKEEGKKEQPKKIEAKKESAKKTPSKVAEEKPKKREEVKEQSKKVEAKKEPPKKEEKKEPIKETPKKEEIKEAPKVEPKIEAIQEESKKEMATEGESINNLETINLSLRERLNIKSQLKRCYIRAMQESRTQYNGIKVTVIADITHDGFIKSNINEATDQERYQEDKAYKASIDNAKRALNLCSPLRNLPSDKYDTWKKVLLDFGEDISQ